MSYCDIYKKIFHSKKDIPINITEYLFTHFIILTHSSNAVSNASELQIP